MSESKGPVIRALCTDIDGTLLDSKRELSALTIAAIRKIHSSIPIVLASSRMPSAMRHLQKQLGILQHPLICYNGAYVLQYDASDNFAALYTTEIPVEICAEVLSMAKTTSIHISLYRDDQWFAPHEDQWTLREATITKVSPVIMDGQNVLSLWKKNHRGAHKIMCMGDSAEIRILENILRSKLENEIHVYHSRSTYLELAPKIVSKASSLKLVLEKLYGIHLSEVIAFGDNYNDIELIKSVGLGIAVNNARPEAKAVAREITGDSKEDGVANAILKYLKRFEINSDTSLKSDQGNLAKP